MTDQPAPFTTDRASCACGTIRNLREQQLVPYHHVTHGQTACLRDPGQAPADPAAVFANLLRELSAVEVLVSLSTSDSERRRAALDGLALARDVLADAAQVLA